MDPKASAFLLKHRICSLAVLLKDGSPHVSTLHYVVNPKNLDIYIMTEKGSKKCQNLLNGDPVKASFVTGFSDEEWITLQMDGTVYLESDKNALSDIHKIYFAGNPAPEKYKNEPTTAFLVFRKNWYRYSEFKPKFNAISSGE